MGAERAIRAAPRGDSSSRSRHPIGRSHPDLRSLRIAVVSSEGSLTNAWRDTLPQLSLAALSALLVSIGIAWWLASKITRPMVQITRASEEMARGNLDPQLALPETADEVGRLSKAFTTMAHEVARSHQTMRDLMANVSHDLRTPLTMITGFSQALLDGTAGPAEAESSALVIHLEAVKMQHLVEDLMQLTRLESGLLVLDQRAVDVRSLVQSAVDHEYRVHAPELVATIHNRVPEATPPVLGDPERLERVLRNLLVASLRPADR